MARNLTLLAWERHLSKSEGARPGGGLVVGGQCRIHLQRQGKYSVPVGGDFVRHPVAPTRETQGQGLVGDWSVSGPARPGND